MSSRRIQTVGVVFGGRSVEHDVSVVTGQQVMQAFDANRFNVVPIYIDRDGRWFTGSPLKNIDTFQADAVASVDGVQNAIISPDIRQHGLIVNPTAGRFQKSVVQRLDVVFPAIHGTHGEDGTLQGLLELADLPYVGCGVMASALANDKITTKTLLRQHNIPVADSVTVERETWLSSPEEVIKIVQETLAYPVFVKPATTGSSIGIGRAADEMMLRPLIDIALNFDRRILIEQGVVGGKEINCAVMGKGDKVRASVLEQPLSWDDFLTFEDKYLHGDEGMKSAERIIPAPLDDALTTRIKETAVRAFQAIDGRGTARMDFLVLPDEGTVVLNEINTLPGSLAFYLWQEEGLSAADVVTQLVELALDAHAEKRRSTYNYRTNLINQTSARGLKGVKTGTKNVTASS